MVDCHIHMVLDGEDWKSAIARHRDGAQEAWVRETLAHYRQRGFSYLRDGGDRWGVCALTKALAPEYGICYRSPLAPLYRSGHYGKMIGLPWETSRELEMLVHSQKTAGADFVKLMISGIMDFRQPGVLTEPGLSPELIRAAVEIAHDAGLPVMVHANGARTVQAAAEAGADSIEHGAYLDREALEAMKERRVIWVPTVSAVGNLVGTGRFDDEAVGCITDSLAENLRVFASLGGLIAPGSDAGAWAVPHGTRSEYAHLERLIPGYDPQPAIRALQQRF